MCKNLYVCDCLFSSVSFIAFQGYRIWTLILDISLLIGTSKMTFFSFLVVLSSLEVPAMLYFHSMMIRLLKGLSPTAGLFLLLTS